LKPESDAELVALAQEGDMEAYNSLVRRWDPSLYRFARRLLGNDEDARDVSQEALVKAYLNIRRLRDPGKFKSWVHHIVLNLCRDRYRSPRSRAVTEAYEEGQPGELTMVTEGPVMAGPDVSAHRSGLSEILESALDRLPPEQRTAILLREYQGLNSEEIAEVTGVPAATVRTRIFYGLKTVRRILREMGIEGQHHA
jgi:RNA polymerase sigma-70 factor (ECF subfamily)